MASMLRAHLAALTLWALACLCSSSPANITGDDVEFLETEFRCEGKSLGAFYADKSTGCRMFHVCARGDHDQLLDLRFACLKGQAFDVQAKACDSAENIVCNDTEILAEDGSSNTISSNGDANWPDLGAVRVRRQLVPFFSSNNLPQTVFSCRGRKLGRFYADTEAGCQLFHVCALGESADELLDFQFLCLNGTVFDDTVQRCLPFAESTCNTKVQDIVPSSTTPVPGKAENTTTAAAAVVAAALPTRREQNEAESTTSAFLEEEYIDEEFTEEVPLGEDEFFEGEVVEESGVRAKRQSPLHSYDALPETTFSCVGKVPGGYYADVEAGCQMYHVCAPGPVGSHHSLQDFKFLCSNGTIFSQNTRACQTWYTVDCAASQSFFRLNDDLSQFQEEQVTTSQTFPDEFVQEQVQEPRPQRPRPQVQQQQPQQQVQQQRPQVQQRRPQVQQVRPQVQQQQARPQVQQQEQPQVQQRRRPRPQVQQRPEVIHEQAFPRDGFLDSQLALLEQTEPVQRLSSQRNRRPVQVPVDPVQEVFQEEQVAFTPQRRRPVRPLLVEESISSVSSAPASAISTLREQEVRQQVHQMAQDQVVSIPEEEGFATTSTFDETLKALVQTQREADARSRALNRQQVVQEEEVRAPAPARRRRVRPSPQNLEEQQPQRPVEIHRVQQLDIVRDNVRDTARDTFTPQRFEIEQEQRVEPPRREPHRALVQRQERPRPQADPNFDNFASQVQAIFNQSPRQASHQASQQATRTPVSFVPSFSSLPSFPISPASTLSVDQLPNLNDLPLFLQQPQQRQQQRTSSSVNNGRQQLQFILQPISSGAQSFQPTPVRFQSSGAGRGRGADDGHVIVLHRGLVVEGSRGNDQLARFAGDVQTGGSGFEFGTGAVPQNLRFRRETTSHDENRQMRIIRAVPVPAAFPKTTFSCQDKVPGRFYADAETNCQTFHLCVNRLSSQSFMCRNGTVFDQRSQACDDQTDALNCVDDPQHYGIGEAFGSSVPVLR